MKFHEWKAALRRACAELGRTADALELLRRAWEEYEVSRGR